LNLRGKPGIHRTKMTAFAYGHSAYKSIDGVPERYRAWCTFALADNATETTLAPSLIIFFFCGPLRMDARLADIRKSCCFLARALNEVSGCRPINSGQASPVHPFSQTILAADASPRLWVSLMLFCFLNADIKEDSSTSLEPC
jgi:hypothetical protein